MLGDVKAESGDESLLKALSSYNEGQRLDDSGEYKKAIQAYDDAIASDPDFPWGYNNHAYLMVSCPDPQFRNDSKALDLAKKAAQLSGNRDWQILDTLAATYAGVGNFEKASEIALAIVAMAPDAAKEECLFYVTRYRSRLPWSKYEPSVVD